VEVSVTNMPYQMNSIARFICHVFFAHEPCTIVPLQNTLHAYNLRAHNLRAHNLCVYICIEKLMCIELET